MRPSIFYFLAFLSMFFSLLVSGQEKPAVLSLHSAIETALKNNLEVQQSNIQAETEHIYLKQARANLLPDLNANLNQGINNGRSIDPYTNSFVNQQITFANPSLGSTVTIFNGFSLLNTIRRNSKAYQAAQLEEQQAKENLTLRVILAYLQVLTNEDLLELSVGQRETSLKQVQRLEVLHKSGAVAPGEYFDLKGQYANDQMAVVTASNNLANSKLLVSQLLNMPYNKDLTFEKLNAEQFSVVYDASPEQIYAAALQNLSATKAAELRKESAEMDIKVARSTYYPYVFLGGNVATNYSSAAFHENVRIPFSDQLDNNLTTSFNVGIAIPLFNAFKTKNAVSLAKLNQKSADLTLKNTYVQLQQLTEQAYFNMEASKASYQTLVDQVSAFSESFRAAEVKFNAGAINSVDYLIAQNNLNRANLNLVATRYDFILRKKILDFYQGRELN